MDTAVPPPDAPTDEAIPGDGEDSGDAAALAAQWASSTEEAVGDRLLGQRDIDQILGFRPHELSATGAGGVRAMVDSGLVAYERLPILELIFDRVVRQLATSLRNFFQETAEVGLEGITAVRFGDYLDSIAVPAQLAVFRAEEWDNAGLVTVESDLAYATFDLLLGGKRGGGPTAQFDGRPFTKIEMQLVKGLVQTVLGEVQLAFQPLCPVRFVLERLERDPRFATITAPASAAILVEIKLEMDGRGGKIDIVLPNATIEPIRDLLVQRFIGEKLGRDQVWEGHLATEIWQSDIAVEAVLHEMSVPLKRVLGLQVGDTLMFDSRPNDLVTLRSGGWTLTEGRIGRLDESIAVQVARPLRAPRTTLSAFEASIGGAKGDRA